MAKSRARWIVGAITGALGCTVPNPLFIQTGDATLDGTSDSSAATSNTTGVDPSGSSGSSNGSSTTTPGSTGSAAVCGDGVIDPGEECDDANPTPGDGCESNCRPLFPKDPALIPGTAGATAIALGDVDGDLDLDVLLAFADCPGPCVKRYINSGPAIFTEDLSINVPTTITHLVAAELGGQNGADLAFASGGFAYVYFDQGIGLPAFQFSGNADSLIAAEIEGGIPNDLLIVDDLNGHINYALATNNGFGNVSSISEVSNPQRAAVADVDKDGVTDFVFTAEGGNGIGLFVDSKHDGAPTGPFFTEAMTARAMTIGNFANIPGQGPNAAFFGTLQTGGSLQVYVNQGGGVFEKFKNNVAAKDDVVKLLAPRLNSETDDNIIAFSPLSLQIFTLVEGDFKAGPSVMLGDQLHDVAAGDLNGDGRVDLAVAGQNNCYILINQSP